MPIIPPPELSMTIDGRPVDPAGTINIHNPADGSVVALSPRCTAQQLDDAVSAARAAFPAWAATPLEERSTYLMRIADALDAHADELATLVTAEQGKPTAEARFEVQAAAWWTRETAAMKLPRTVNQDDATKLSITKRVPLGVVAAITPWNYPIGQTGFKVGPALLAGNTVILKPSTFTPLATLRMGELLREILPAGVLNVIAGDDDLGPLMTAHPGIDKISFTGSTTTGRAVATSAAATLKRVTLELGGNDPAIVMPDVDLNVAIPKIFWTCFANAGQICIAAKRVYVHDAIYDAFAARFADFAHAVVVGRGDSAGTQMGPLSTLPQYERVLDLIADARSAGLRFLAGGDVPEGPGYFVRPTIIDNPPETSRIVQEEQFGPVVPLLRYFDSDEVVARANAVAFGLGASIWCADINAGAALAARLQAGTVTINDSMQLSPNVTFGGLKQSGLGSESGLEGLLAFTEPRTVIVARSPSA